MYTNLKIIDANTEIIKENNYYPFGLKHKGYNDNVSANTNSIARKFGYNGVENEEALGLNLMEMDMRQYDPAIARWTSIDPVIHHSLSPYSAFDNNPIFWADPSGADSIYNWDTGQYVINGQEVSFDEALSYANNGGNSDGSNNNTVGGSGKNKSISNNSDFIQSYPDSIDFVNTNSAEEKEKFLEDVVNWFGHVDQFGSPSIHPGSIIDFYAEPKIENEKSWGVKILDILEDIIGGDSNDHNNVTLNDGNGNYVKIGYFKNTKENAGIYSGSSVDFEGRETIYNGSNTNTYRISIRSHAVNNGIPPAVVYMLFTGTNKDFYNKIYNRIKSYKPYRAKRIPYKKN